MAEIVLGILAVLFGTAAILIAILVVLGTAMGRATAPGEGKGAELVALGFALAGIALFALAGFLFT